MVRPKTDPREVSPSRYIRNINYRDRQNDDQRNAKEKEYRDGEGANLVLKTPTRAFRVRKWPLIRKSSWFKAKCHGSVASQIVEVAVEERDFIIDAILRYCQGIDSWFDERGGSLLALIDLRNAAAKYDILPLAKQVETRFIERMSTFTLEPIFDDIIDLSSLFHDSSSDLDSMRREVAKYMSSHLQAIAQKDTLWDALYSNEDFFRAVLQAKHT